MWSTLLFVLYLWVVFRISYTLRVATHPLESRIAYVYDVPNIRMVDPPLMDYLKTLFHEYPLLIIKGQRDISPQIFLDFVSQFDPDCDRDALMYPEKHPHQLLQPFDQFPNCQHVAPRGNVVLEDFHQIKHVNVTPHDAFMHQYVWHTDLLGHRYKLPNVVTGFHIIQQPVIGGETDFISGEAVYEGLTEYEKYASHNVLLEVNNRKFITKKMTTDYSGSNRLEDFVSHEDGNMLVPLAFAPEGPGEGIRILLKPTFIERVVGWSVPETRRWLRRFMAKKVLPHRVSVQWQAGDLAVLNNRRFIHSSTPARNYMDNTEDNCRFLLQTFVPTLRPLKAVRPLESKVYCAYNAKWIRDQEKSIISAHDHIDFAKERPGGVLDDYYTVARKFEPDEIPEFL